MIYLHLAPDADPPAILALPSRFVVVAEVEVSLEWQQRVSDWMVASGCLYMMAWGCGCSTWDDSVDWANIDRRKCDPIPDNELVMTTWHDDESLIDVFEFSKTVAEHSCVDIVRTVILDISTRSRKEELVNLYLSA